MKSKTIKLLQVIPALFILTILPCKIFALTQLIVNAANSPYTVNSSQNYDLITVQSTGSLIVNSTLVCNTSNFNVDGKMTVNSGGIVQVYGQLWINGGGKVRLNNGAAMHMQPFSCIIVTASQYTGQIDLPNTPGGILEAGSATITCADPNQYWGGIYVTSIYNFNIAYPGTSPFSYSQQSIYPGRVLLSGTTISRAFYGVCNWWPTVNGGAGVADFTKPLYTYNLVQASTAGGIIKASGCNFENNRISAYFIPYQNYKYDNALTGAQNYLANYSNKREEASFFSNCYFHQTSSTLYNTETFVAAKGVIGLKISGCYFKDDMHNLRLAAVEANDAGLKIDQLCTSISSGTGVCMNAIQSKFEGMPVGINALGAPSTIPFSIRNSRFENMYKHGIVITGYSQPEVINNHILLHQNTLNYYAGIVMQGSSGFRTEENSITTDVINPNLAEYTYGIVVNNSHGDYDEIYKNSLGKSSIYGTGSLKYAMQANGINYNINYKELGLKFLCNDMSNNIISYDNYDVLVAPVTGTSNSGIAKVQGIPTTSGGTLQYIAAQNVYAPRNVWAFVNFNDFHIFDNTYHNSSDKLSYKVSTVSASPTFYDVNKMTNVYFSNSNTCPSKSYYSGTASMSASAFRVARAGYETSISTTTAEPLDANDNNIQQAYIVEYAQLNNGMIHKYLYPETTINTTSLMDTVVNDTLVIRTDSTRVNIDSTRMVIGAGKYTHTYRLWLAGMFARANNYASAYNTLDDISTDDFYTLSTDEQDEVDIIHDLIAVADSLHENDNSWDSLTISTKNWIRDIAMNGGGYPRYWARYFMATYADTYYEPDFNTLPPVDIEERALFTNSIMRKNTMVKIYPNPAEDELHVDVGESGNAITLAVYDMVGRKLVEANAKMGDNTLSLTTLAPGMYIVRVNNGDKVIEVKSIVKK